jgi:hypothetical protein
MIGAPWPPERLLSTCRNGSTHMWPAASSRGDKACALVADDSAVAYGHDAVGGGRDVVIVGDHHDGEALIVSQTLE